MGYPIQQSQTAQPLVFLMVDSTDHLTGKTGLSPTVTLSKNGAAFASPAGAVTEIGSGWYKVAGNATDAATLGPLAFHATSAGADPTDDRFDVVAYNPQDSVRFGLSGLANATAGGAGGLALVGSNMGTSTSVTGAVGSVTGAVGSVTGAVGSVTGAVGSVTGAVASVTGAVGSVTAGVTVTTNSDKTGYALSAGGVTAVQSGLSTYAGGDTSGTTTLLGRIAAALTITGGAVNVNDKTGFKLASDGLDTVAAPATLANDAAGRASFVGMIRALFNRFYNDTRQTATQQTVRNDAGSVVSTMAVSDDGTTQTRGKSA